MAFLTAASRPVIQLLMFGRNGAGEGYTALSSDPKPVGGATKGQESEERWQRSQRYREEIREGEKAKMFVIGLRA